MFSRVAAALLGLLCFGSPAGADPIPFTFTSVGNEYRLTLPTDPKFFHGFQHSSDLRQYSMRQMASGSPGPTFGFTPAANEFRAFFRAKGISVAEPEDWDNDSIDDLWELQHPYLNPRFFPILVCQGCRPVLVTGMSTRSLIALAAFGATAAFAGDSQSPVAEDPQSMVPGFDASRILFSQSGDMDLHDDDGSLEVTDIAVRSFLCHPVRPIEGLYVLPEAGYRFTRINAGGQTGPLQDEDLHSIDLSLYVLGMPAGSPWIYGAWARAELATDFKVISGDDFSFDLAGGIGYRFNDSFTFAVGAAVTNLNGYPSFYPGIGFDWIASEKLRIGFYGPTGMAAYALNEYWLFTLRFDFAGGVWNIEDDNGQSQSVDLTDNRLGIYASRRLTENLWLTAGAGLTIANEINYTTPAGHGIFGSDLDTAPYGLISLRMKAW